MIDNVGFALISCIRNGMAADAGPDRFQSLNVPAGYRVDQEMLQGNFSIPQGYNFAMRHSTAKYKIYLNPSVAILNQNLLADVLSLFQAHPELGMLGVLGARQLPANGVWWEAAEKSGKMVLPGKSISFPSRSGADYESVQAVDGAVMITQYDIPWREGAFAEVFYDTAQCLEFLKAGYAVGIPRQDQPWCAYNNPDSLFQFYHEREAFIREYAGMIPI